MITFTFYNKFTSETLEVLADDMETAEIELSSQIRDEPTNWVGTRNNDEDPIGLFDELED